MSCRSNSGLVLQQIVMNLGSRSGVRQSRMQTLGRRAQGAKTCSDSWYSCLCVCMCVWNLQAVPNCGAWEICIVMSWRQSCAYSSYRYTHIGHHQRQRETLTQVVLRTFSRHQPIFGILFYIKYYIDCVWYHFFFSKTIIFQHEVQNKVTMSHNKRSHCEI